jgi:hypothetical protein
MFRVAALALLATLTQGEKAQPRPDTEYLRKLSPLIEKKHKNHEEASRRRMIDVTAAAQTASELANLLVGNGVTVSSATLTCNSLAYGTFSNAEPVFGINDGIILSSGRAVGIQGPNQQDNESTSYGLPGDVDLDTLVEGGGTRDACTLEFDFSCDSEPKGFSFSYVFASEEWNEFAFTSFNDVFGFFLDGTNVAIIPGTTTPVSINTINCGNPYNPLNVGTNCNLYVNNDLSDGAGGLDTEADGFTVPLYVSQPSLSSGMHHMKLAVADVDDHIFDSHVLIQAGSLVCAPPPTTPPTPSSSLSPSSQPSESPSSSPSSMPTVSCTFCDFSGLTVYPSAAVNATVADGTVNGEALHSGCGMTVTRYNTTAKFITVLDSQSPVRNTRNSARDPDLGSPSRTCGGVGRGKGGKKGKLWENCEPLGNVLILQDTRYSYPNDHVGGGCMKFTFDVPVTNITLGLLDIDSAETAAITVCPTKKMKNHKSSCFFILVVSHLACLKTLIFILC